MDILSIVKISSHILSGIFIFLSSLFIYWETAENNKHEKSRKWFQEKWAILGSSSWIKVPDVVIKYLLNIEESFLNSVIQYGHKLTFKYNWYSVISVTIIVISSLHILSQKYLPFFYVLIILIPLLVITIIVFFVAGLKSDDISSFKTKFPKIFRILFVFIFSSQVALIIFSSIIYFLSADIYYSIVIFLLLIPGYGNLFLIIFLSYSTFFLDKKDSYLLRLSLLFSFAFSISLFITLFSMLLGHIIIPNSYIPKTIQMLIANAFFDGMTLVMTIIFLSWASEKNSLIRIPIIIPIDIIVSIIFACGSLYFGLLNTVNSLSIYEVFNILIAKSADGSMFEFGPYFWTMHTAFIPTFIYIFVLLIAWLSKSILKPIYWFFGKAKTHANPLKLTAAFFGLLVVIMTLFTQIISYF